MFLSYVLFAAAAVAAAGMHIFDARAQRFRARERQGIVLRLIPVRWFQPSAYTERGRGYVRAALTCLVLTIVFFGLGAITLALAT